MNKRLIALLLVMVMMIAAIMTGCGTADKSDSSNGSTANTTTADNKTEALKVGFILLGSIKDGGWTQAHSNGIDMLKKETGVDVLYKENVPEGADSKKAMKELIDAGCNVIFATSFGYGDYTYELSKEYPKVKFYHCSGDKLNPNMSNYFGRMYEPRYLSGIVAGLKTKSNKLGFVGAYAYPEVISGINAFTLGAQLVNPDVTVKVRWINTWYDPTREKAAAEVLLNEGCDVIAQHGDTAGPMIAAETKNVWAVGYDLDNKTAAPKAYMTAPIWNWGKYYVAQIKELKEGKFKSEAYYGGMKDGIIDLAPLTSVAPSNAQAKVDEMKKKILDGTFKVFEGEIKDNAGKVVVEKGKSLTDKEILSMTWLAKGVEAKEEFK